MTRDVLLSAFAAMVNATDEDCELAGETELRAVHQTRSEFVLDAWLQTDDASEDVRKRAYGLLRWK